MTSTIEADELAKLLSSLNIEIDDEALESYLKEIDADGSGNISKDEFMLWFLKVEPQNSLQFTAFTERLMRKLPEVKNL
jgi:Ca2+-binding EF-hand superfamily protein